MVAERKAVVLVGVVALPLAKAFAIASGARPEQGFYTAIVAGLCTSAHIFAPLFGGFAATGAIARTATNIRNGASSPIAGMAHCCCW